MMNPKTLVWAKMKYCPWWPALVWNGTQLKKKKGNGEFVFFFGSRDFAWIEEHNLKQYVEYRQKFNKPNLSRKFYEAVSCIDEYISDPVKYKINAEQDFIPKTPARKAQPKLHTTKKETYTKFTSVTSHRYPKRNLQKNARTEQLNRPAPPLPMCPNESPIYMEKITPRISNLNLSPRYGVLGLENIGRTIAVKLINSGYEVFVFDKYTPHMVGARTVLSPSELIEKVDIIFSCNSDPSVSHEIFYENCGLLKTLTIFEGKGFIQMMCLDDKMSQEIAKSVIDSGGRYLEALVHGPKNGAEPGSRIVLADGDQKLFNECLICLQAIGTHVLFFGKSGSAAGMYLVLQMMFGISTAALAEGMALATRLGLSCKTMLDIMKATNMLSPLLSEKAKAIMTLDFEVHDSLRDTQKDLRLAVALGDKLYQPMPLTATASEMYLGASRRHSKEDSSSVFMRMIH